ncbi:MAG: DsrE family protein [Cyclobacteriaceae bacterium]|nr:DsrE family protein [Cyclobacteriaceae bacterium]
MKHFTLCIISLCLGSNLFAQEKINPVVKNFGGIYPIPHATVKTDPNIEYKIIIDVLTGTKNPADTAWSLINVARMLNLHAVSGANMNTMEVVLAVHGSATYTILNNETYRNRFEVDNPNIPIIKELQEAGVKFTVCGQSMQSRGVKPNELFNKIEIATSMLTTVTTYQLKGYAFLRF